MTLDNIQGDAQHNTPLDCCWCLNIALNTLPQKRLTRQNYLRNETVFSQLSAGYCHWLAGWLVGGKSCLSVDRVSVCPRYK